MSSRTLALRDFLRADKEQYTTLRSIFHGFFTQNQAGSGFHEITEAQMQRTFKEAEAIRIAASKRTITTDEVRKLHYAEAFKAAHDLDSVYFNRPTDIKAQAQATQRFEELCALHGISKKKRLSNLDGK